MNDKSKIWLSPPHLLNNEKEALAKLLDSNWVTTGGPATVTFENRLKEYLDVESIVALNSGTSAIHLALLLAGVTRGDSVICQTMSFVASANPVLYVGARPIFIDSESDTWNMCPANLEDAILNEIKVKNKKPAAIIAVHSYGMPFRVKEIVAISKKYEIPLIEDAAEALGSAYQGKKCGSFGDFSAFSFNGNKIITAGAGGALVIKDKKYEGKARHLANQAKTGNYDYTHDMLGFNYGMSGLSAALATAQLNGIEKKIELKRANFSFYRRIFDPIKEVFILEEPNFNFESNFWLNCILLKAANRNDRINKEALRHFLEKQNIESRMLWKPLHRQPFYKECSYYGGNIADDLYEKGLCLPSGSNLIAEEKKRIKVALTTFFKNNF